MEPIINLLQSHPYLILVALFLLVCLILKLIPGRKYKYKRRDLLTKTELAFFRQLQEHADENSLLIFPKVRLADIIKPDERQKRWQAAFNKIKSKHVDFILCDKTTLDIKYIIELDDKSHERPDRKERDDFVDAIMAQCKLKIIHIKTANEYDFSML